MSKIEVTVRHLTGISLIISLLVLATLAGCGGGKAGARLLIDGRPYAASLVGGLGFDECVRQNRCLPQK